jgi:hypothetical protein
MYRSTLYCPKELRQAVVKNLTRVLSKKYFLRRLVMTERLVEVTSVYPGLLSSLITAKQEAPYTFVKREGGYYLSCFDTDDPMSTEKATQSADVILANINAMLTLPPFKVANAIKRTDHVITLNDNGSIIGERTMNLSTRVGIGPDFTTLDFSSVLEIGAKASRLSRIKQALWYYAGGLNWFNLYGVYETIQKDFEEVTGEKDLPEHWTMDTQRRNRLKDFTESANNAHISGYAARHTFANSYEIEKVSSDKVKLKNSGQEIIPMTLRGAGAFIENLLMHWLKYRISGSKYNHRTFTALREPH